MTNEQVLQILGRRRSVFASDVASHRQALMDAFVPARTLVIGGAGSIGSAVVARLFGFGVRSLHVVDLTENGLVEVVRDLRSSLGYTTKDFRTFAVDFLSPEFEALVKVHGPYDYVLNFSALKHVRSEKDPFTLGRMLNTNIGGAHRVIELLESGQAHSAFSVSTDKACRPVNAMGATKRWMEVVLFGSTTPGRVTSSRFANVAFSDGSLLQGFERRLAKRQPIAVPTDIRRFFLTPDESAWLCLMAAAIGKTCEIFVPKTDTGFDDVPLLEIAERFLRVHEIKPRLLESEADAREMATRMGNRPAEWPVFAFTSDTTGEKEAEEFIDESERVESDRFAEIDVIVAGPVEKSRKTASDAAWRSVQDAITRRSLDRGELLSRIHEVVPEFTHFETGKYLDDKM
ncbi:MAG: polysaccharide biosynthesis protein [Acidobacteria bacterium]|nr:polysaccharide biosynthesis protein [Acidobacteriota bacterium]